MGRECATRLKSIVDFKYLAALSTDITGLVTGASVSGLVASIMNISWLQPGIAAIAAATGITVPEAVAVLLAFSVLVAVQILLVAAQITAYDLFNRAPNGVCLKHPSLTIAAGFLVVGPVALAGLNIPPVVLPR